MMMMVMTAADGLSQILYVGELAALGGAGEVRRQLVKLGRLCRVAAGCGGLRGGVQVGGDLLRNLRVLGRIRLLKLLQCAHHLSERRKLGVLRLRRHRRRAGAAGTASGRAVALEN